MLELAADEVSDEDQALVGAVAAGSGFGSLDQPVHGLQEAIAQAAAEVAEDAFVVVLQGLPDALEGRQPAAASPTDPCAQLGLGFSPRVGVAEDLAQSFFETPGPRGLQATALQVMHGLDLLRAPLLRRLQQSPATALEFGRALGLG